MHHIKIVLAVPTDILAEYVAEDIVKLPIKDMVSVMALPFVSAHWLIEDHCFYSLYDTAENDVFRTNTFILDYLKQDITYAFYAALVNPWTLEDQSAEVELLAAQNKLHLLEMPTIEY